MPSRPPPIGRIRLARSRIRLWTPPLILALAGGAAGAAALHVGGAGGIGLAVAGGALVAIATIGALALASLRLEVEESSIRLRWLGGHRTYPLARGPVTRVTLRGPNASKLRARLGAFGWGVGGAVLRGEERIEVARLARTRTAILIPTERGRLAIAPADEADLLTALSRAAQARQRLDEIAVRAPAARARPEAAAAAEARPALAPHVMTGIERAQLERRLAAERAAVEAVEAAAAAERAAAEAPMLPAVTTQTALLVVRAPRARPSWLRVEQLGTTIGLVVLPLVATGGMWLGAEMLGRMPERDAQARLVFLALVLAGPATAVGAIMARAWWPRLMGLVVACGLAALAVAGRALLAV